MASVGLLLKKERERKKISLDDVSAQTKIGKKYLTAIESDNYTIFPGETYIIGFIRNYARVLGLDSAEVINLYKAMKVGSNIEEDDESETGERIQYEKKRTPVRQESFLERLTKNRKAPAQPENFEVVELVEELPEKSDRTKKGQKEKTAFTKEDLASKLFKSPLKEKKLIDMAHLVIGAGALATIIILILVIKFIVHSFSSGETKGMPSIEGAIPLDFTANVLESDFVPNEYRTIILGEKTYNILFEKLTGITPVNDLTKPGQEVSLEFVFRINDITIPFKLNEEKSIDFDYDTQNDLKIKVISYNNDLIKARIEKLHPFITAISNQQVSPMTNSKTNAQQKKNTAKFQSESIKQKIIFDAKVIKNKSFIKAWVDGAEQESKIYYPGDKIYYEANDTLQIKIGNAGALDVKINNVPQKLGKSGEVANKIIKWERDPYDESKYNLKMKDWQ